jgi:PGF-pre-PGF domain-containing protein
MNVDTTAPSITIISPVNITYSNASILLNVTTNQTANVTYSLNGNGNQSLYNRTTSGNATITGTEGANNITIYANDSAGNLNSSIVYFTVDATSPVIIINTPANGSTTNDQTPLLNATFSGETVTYAWYRVNNTGNSTPVSNTNNLTVTLSSLPDGAHNVTVYANDSAGNLNSSIAYFTVDTTPPTTPQTSSGGGGTGSSGVVTAEPSENIARSEMIEKNLEPGKTVTYTFMQNQDIVYEVSVTGKEYENNIAMRIEILKDRSKQAKENAPGLVYRNVNIILGTEKIGENVIKFKVNDSWLLENGFDSSDIRLVKWVDNKWITLETGVLFNKDGYTHFMAKSMTFSIYAITGIKNEESMPAPLATGKIAVTPEATPLMTEKPTPQPEGKTSLWIWMILAVLLIAALVYGLKRR